LTAIGQLFRCEVSVIDFDDGCARDFGPLRVAVRRQGVNVSPIDLLIASVALHHDLTLVMHNVRDFQNIPGLRLKDWLTP
jgi:tRNA(fMet)-specific endonuclease VapC